LLISKDASRKDVELSKIPIESDFFTKDLIESVNTDHLRAILRTYEAQGYDKVAEVIQSFKIDSASTVIETVTPIAMVSTVNPQKGENQQCKYCKRTNHPSEKCEDTKALHAHIHGT
jgi:hypothetical protein